MINWEIALSVAAGMIIYPLAYSMGGVLVIILSILGLSPRSTAKDRPEG